MALKDYAGKHSSEWPDNHADSVIIGYSAPAPPHLKSADDIRIGAFHDGVPADWPLRDVVLATPNRERGGSDTYIVISEDGVWIRGLDEYIEKRVAAALARSAESMHTCERGQGYRALSILDASASCNARASTVVDRWVGGEHVFRRLCEPCAQEYIKNDWARVVFTEPTS